MTENNHYLVDVIFTYLFFIRVWKSKSIRNIYFHHLSKLKKRPISIRNDDAIQKKNIVYKVALKDSLYREQWTQIKIKSVKGVD